MGSRFGPFRVAVVFVVVAAATSLLTVGAAAAKPAKTKFSGSVADYIPATIAGKAVVMDPRSPSGHAASACQVPLGGVVVAALNDKPTTEADGGVWDCPAGQPDGTGFLVGIDSAAYPPGTAKLSKKGLAEPDPTGESTTSNIATRVLKIGGHKVTVYTARGTANISSPAGPAGTVFEGASAEPYPRLVITATVPAGGNPVSALKEMLRAGAGQVPRADREEPLRVSLAVRKRRNDYQSSGFGSVYSPMTVPSTASSSTRPRIVGGSSAL